MTEKIEHSKQEIEQEALRIVELMKSLPTGSLGFATVSGPRKGAGELYRKAFYRLVRRGIVEQVGFGQGRKTSYALASAVKQANEARYEHWVKVEPQLTQEIETLLRSLIVNFVDLKGAQKAQLLLQLVRAGETVNLPEEMLERCRNLATYDPELGG